MHAVLVALVFASGCCALVYQTVWLRSLRLVFGSSTPATAAVLAIFMGGLGLGAAWLGRRLQTHERPLRAYALLELGIALGAALSLPLVALVNEVYLALGGSAALGHGPATVVRLLLGTLAIGGPAVLMGGTLPAVARAATAEADATRRGLSLLYGANTLGSVLGALLTTFLLFEAWGVRATTLAACAVNVLVAALALALDRRAPALPVEESAPDVVTPATADPTALLPRSWALATAFTLGFSFFLAELVWYRLASPILGGSTFTFGLVLATALLGIGAGGLLYAWLPPTTPRPSHLAIACLLEAVALMVPLALGDRLALLAFHLRSLGVTFGALVLGWSVILTVLVLPAALVAGYQLPLLLALKGRGPKDVATDVGQVYAANTLGAIAGALLGGFALLPALGALGAWRVAAGAVFLLAGALAALRPNAGDAHRLAAAGALGLVLLVTFPQQGPTAVWRHSAIGAGRAELGHATWNQTRAALERTRRGVLREIEGRESSLAFTNNGGTALLVNGKSDGNARDDAPTTVLLGLLGAILHDDPRRAFVIGMGSGQTGGWIAAIDSVTTVDLAELEPGVLEFAELCAISNHGVVGHPKVTLLVGDGREQLLTRRGTYDLIVSEPSNPYRAGVASLYSVDFYERARERLAPGGLFVQWLQCYEVDAETVRLVLASLRHAFEFVSVWLVGTGDLAIVAGDVAPRVDVEQVRARLAIEPYRTGFGRVAGVFDPEGLLALHLAGPALADVAAIDSAGRRPVNSDDHPLLEYRFARSVARSTTHVLEVLETATRLGAQRPALVGDVDWSRVELLRMRPWHVANRPAPEFPMHIENARYEAFWRSLERKDVANALSIMSSLPAMPPTHDVFERLAWAQAFAQRTKGSGGPSPEAFARELDTLAKAGAASDVACIRFLAALSVEGQPDARRLALEVVEAVRRDPWVGEMPLRNALAAVGRLEDPASAVAVGRALLEAPFALFNCERERRDLIVALARTGNDPELAAAALALNEPHPVWERKALALRAESYRKAGMAELAARAEADLAEFDAHEAPSMREVFDRR